VRGIWVFAGKLAGDFDGEVRFAVTFPKGAGVLDLVGEGGAEALGHNDSAVFATFATAQGETPGGGVDVFDAEVPPCTTLILFLRLAILLCAVVFCNI